MIIERKIGRVSVDIDIKEANEVYVESDYVGLIKEEGISGILNALYDANRIEHMPLSLFMELTSRCNFSCPFCYINEEQTEYTENPSFPELQKILDYFIEKGLLHCVLSGGECLLHPDFPKIYKYLKEAGVLVTVFSNGYLFNEEIFSLFERYKPFKVEISIYGSDDLTYNVTTNRKNIKAKKVFDNIIRLKEMGINIVCKTPITSFTEKSYPIIEKWCFENDIPYYTGIELMDTYTGNSRKEYLSSEKIRKELREKSDKEFFENKEMMEIGYSKKEKKCNFDCSAGKTDIFINSDCQLLPCMKAAGVEEWKFDIKMLGIDEAYTALQKKISDVKGKALKYCVGCEHHKVCQECIMTQYDHKDVKEHRIEYCLNLKEFMKKD